MAILIYFSVCGFVFGFLWARLYLPKWFHEADKVQELEEKVSRLEKQQEADARALALVTRQINPEVGETRATQQELAEAIKASSVPARITIFSMAEKARTDKETSGNDLRLQGIVSIFEGLVACDKDIQYHRNHSALAHALRLKKDYESADTAFTKAIEIRNRRGVKGWKSYEFYRALSRIERNPQFKNNQPSDPADVKKVRDDLAVVHADAEKWTKYYEENRNNNAIVTKWMQLNNLRPEDLTGS